MPSLAAKIKPITRFWLILALLIYAAFIALDIIDSESPIPSAVKYLGIFLCPIYAFLATPRDNLLVLALALTFLADSFLVWTEYFSIGHVIFCLAHFAHTIRLVRSDHKFLRIYFPCLILFLALSLVAGTSPFYAIVSVYAIAIITNLILSLRWLRDDRSNIHARSAALGFTLFVLCDASVAISFLATQSMFPAAIGAVAHVLVWLFYFPSQVLISNSPIAETSNVS